MTDSILLTSENLCKSFGITRAVRDVSFSIRKGEIHGLIGENGSGKSTFSAMLTGIYTIDSGRFILDGAEYRAGNQIEANRKGVSIIVQETGTVDSLTVAENIFLGKEDQFVKFGVKNTTWMNHEAQRLLREYGYDRIKAEVVIDHYNFEDRKLIEMVKATYFNPKLVVVDETTTALSQEGRLELYDLMDKIRADGRTVIFISHDLAEVIAHTDRISVLRDGAYIDTVETKNVTEDDLRRLMVGRELGTHYYRTDYDEAKPSDVVLRVRNLSVPKAFSNVSFDLHQGEIIGFGGLSECGMHELGKALFAGSYGRTGKVTLADGTEINSIPTAISRSVAYASKDRDSESLVSNTSIRDNICLPSVEDLSLNGLVFKKNLDKFADDNASRISVKMTGIAQSVSELSGGNKQKVVLARWLGKGSDIMILDSPTRGIDVKVKADIYSLMTELRNQGKSIIMISEEILELIGMCDRILIMRNGSLSGEFLRRPELNEEDLIAKMV